MSERNCLNCKFADLSGSDEPCYECDMSDNEWQPVEPLTTQHEDRVVELLEELLSLVKQGRGGT